MKRFRSKLLVAVIAALATAVTAWAFYSTAGAGDGDVTVGSFTPATISVPAASTGTHAVSWTAQASLSDTSKNSQIKYVVQRSLDGGSFANVPNGPCSGELPHGTTTSCSDTVTTAGSYTYRVVSKYSGWTATSNEAGAVVVTLGVAPAAPASVALANGGGVGNAYINDANKASLNVTVGLGGTSLATDTVHVTITDGPHTTADTTAPATTGSGSVTVTGIDASALNDGSVTIRATSSNAAGTSSPTTTDVTKDTVKPSSSAGSVGNIVNPASTFTVPYSTTEPGSNLDEVRLYVDGPSAGDNYVHEETDTDPSQTGESFSYDGATTNGTYRFYTRALDNAGNLEDAPTTPPDSSATRANPTPPTVAGAAIAKTEGLPNSTAGFIRAFAGAANLGTYRVYANVTAGGGTVSTVTADTSTVPGGNASVSLSGCSADCTVNGVTYNYVSSEQTAVAGSAGVRGFSVTASDNASQSHTLGDTTTNSALKVTVDNTNPTGNTPSATNGGSNAGLAEPGDKINFTYSEAIDGVSILGSWFWPWTSVSTEVRVTLVDGTSSDSLSITTADGTTALPFATSLSFNSGAYITGGNAIFGGSGATQASTLSISGSTVTVTLGSRNGGDGTLVDINGNNRLNWTPLTGATAPYDAAGNRVVANTPAGRQSANTTQW